jgi:hypothetical protein
MRIVQHFGIYCSCHLRGECAEAGPFSKRYIGQAAGGELGFSGADWWSGDNNGNVCRNMDNAHHLMTSMHGSRSYTPNYCRESRRTVML